MISLLIVDDEISLAEQTSFFLSKNQSVICEIAESGLQALEMIKNTNYDVVVSDYEMPGLNGIELMKATGDIENSPPFIIFTGRERESVAIEALNAGAQFYLQKGGDMTVQFHELSNMVRKVVDKKRAENRLIHINHLYAVLSNINEKVVKITEPRELYSELCTIAIDKGEFSMAWVGLSDSDKREITPVTHAGRREGYFGQILLDIVEEEGFYSQSGTAIREGHCIVSNDIENVLLISKWKEETIRKGYRSKASVPFMCRERIVGTFNLYSERPGFFEGHVIELLENIGRSISYALEHIQYQRERRLYDESISKANAKLNILSSITRHDILNQITALLGYLEISKVYVKEDKVMNLIEKEELITSTIRKQIEFTKDYQDIGVKPPLWQDISLVIKKTIRNIKLQNTVVRTEDLEFEVFTDPLLEKIFFNLFDNSLKYAVNLKNINLFCEKLDESLVIIYEDDGPGIPIKEKETIFMKGYGKNSGLGLFLSREILSITGSSIFETGVPEKGVRFEIRVPKGLYREVRSRSDTKP